MSQKVTPKKLKNINISKKHWLYVILQQIECLKLLVHGDVKVSPSIPLDKLSATPPCCRGRTKKIDNPECCLTTRIHIADNFCWLNLSVNDWRY